MITAKKAQALVAERVANRPVATLEEIEESIMESISRYSLSMITDKRITSEDIATLQSLGYTVNEGTYGCSPESTLIQWGNELVPY